MKYLIILLMAGTMYGAPYNPYGIKQGATPHGVPKKLTPEEKIAKLKKQNQNLRDQLYGEYSKQGIEKRRVLSLKRSIESAMKKRAVIKRELDIKYAFTKRSNRKAKKAKELEYKKIDRYVRSLQDLLQRISTGSTGDKRPTFK